MTKARPHAAAVRALIVDDEPLAREHLRALLADEPDVDVVGEAGGGSTAIQLIGALEPDLVFLDVQMPGCDGFQVLSAIAPTHAPVVVFVTAYDAHALRAFDVAAVDYLLKPVVEARFRAAVRRAVKRVRESAGESASRRAALLATLAPLAGAEEPFPIRADGRVTFVKPREIDWIDADDDTVRVHVGERVYVMRETMTAIEGRLPPGFVRIHRSTIVNRDRIREIQPWFKGDFVLVLADGTRLTSGRTYQAHVRQLIK